VSTEKSTATAKIRSLRAGYKRAALVGLPVLTQQAARARLDAYRLGDVDDDERGKARDRAQLQRNATAALQYRYEKGHVHLAKPLVGLVPEAASTGGGLELFLPALKGAAWASWFGLGASVASADAGRISGRVAGSEAVQAVDVTTSETQARIVFRPVFPWRLPARAEVAVVVVDQVEAKLDAGDAGTTTAAATGLGVRLGLAAAPSSGTLLGVTWDAPLAKKLTLEREGGAAPASKATGKYQRSDVDLWLAVRWPPPSLRSAVFGEVRGGLIFRDERTRAEDATGARAVTSSDQVPWLGIGAGYVR
jgi:hypothetical protein